MIGSFGCPYSCSFCIDATVPYQPLDYDELKADLPRDQRTIPAERMERLTDLVTRVTAPPCSMLATSWSSTSRTETSTVVTYAAPSAPPVR